MRGFGYIGLCVAVAFASGIAGVAVAQEAAPPGFVLVEPEAPTLESLRRRASQGLIYEAEAGNMEGRYQIVPMGVSPSIWVLDSMTGLVRLCGARLHDPGASDPLKQVTITCSPWAFAGR